MIARNAERNTMKEKRNEFSAPRMTSDGRPTDVRSHCEVFKMTAVDEDDMKFLAHLYRTIWISGGSVTINDGKVEETYSFGG